MDLMNLLAKLTLDKQEYDKGLEDAESDAKKKLNISQPSIPKPDNSEFKAGLQEAEGTGNMFKEVMIGVWQGVKDAIVVTGVTSAVMAVVGAMRQGIDMAIDNGKAISDGAKNLGISTKAYQEYQYVLGKSNLSIKDLSTAMKKMDEIAGGKKMTKDQAKWLDELGLKAEDAADKEKFLGDAMRSLANYNGSDKGRIIEWLFGSNQNWDGYFSQTSSEIENLKSQAESMGLIMSDDAVQNAVDFKTATEEISERIEAIKLSFGQSVIPMLTDAVKMVQQIMVFFSGGDKTLAEKLAGGDKELEENLLTIEGTSAAAQTLADKLIEMGNTAEMTAEQYEIWKGTADQLIKLVPTLGDVIDTETGQINGSTEAIKENIKEWENLAKQKAVQAIKEEKYQEIVSANKDLINQTIDANNKAGEADRKRVESLGKVNAVLEKYGVEGLGENATMEDYQAAKQQVMNSMYGDEYGMAQAMAELSNASSEWSSAIAQAADAQRKVEDLQKQLDEGMAAYEEWVAGLDAIYGTAATDADTATGKAQALKETIDSIPDYKRITLKEERLAGSFAIGSNYIPYDMPAMLHRGERVLTATENRKGEGSGTADLSHLEDRIAAAIRAGMEGVSVNSYLNGRAVTEEVNRNNMRDVKGRRFSR